MKEYAGVWIDRNNAIIVSVLGEEHSITTVKSNLDETAQVPREPQDADYSCYNDIADKIVMRGRQEDRLQGYYLSVADSLRDAFGIIILGPDDLKTGLAGVIKNMLGESKIAAVEWADSMDKNLIAARVKTFFCDHEEDNPRPEKPGNTRRNIA